MRIAQQNGYFDMNINNLRIPTILLTQLHSIYNSNNSNIIDIFFNQNKIKYLLVIYEFKMNVYFD